VVRSSWFGRRLGPAVMVIALASSFDIQASTPAERGQWAASMGESGLRRSYASGSDLGELVNRAVSYQLANRVYTAELADNPDLRARDVRSRVESYVAQNDSLIPLDVNLARPLYIRALGRVAWRDERSRVSSRNDRLDLGLLYAPSRYSYISVGMAGENTRSDLRFIEGRTSGEAWGPRLDAGVVMNSIWSVATRYDHMRYDGDNVVRVPTAQDTLTIARDVEYTRQYLNVEAIGRYSSTQIDWLPDGMQLRWHNLVQYLYTDYKRQTDSLGRAVQEPFGRSERLGIARTGGNISYPLGEDRDWLLSTELTADFEFDTNMNYPISDRLTGSWALGMTRLFGPGQRAMLEYQRYASRSGQRSRNTYSLIAVLDI